MTDFEKFRLAGEVAIVTSGGAGIGRAICEIFAAAGAAIVVSDPSRDSAETVATAIAARGGSAIAVPCDLTNGEELDALVASAVERFGRLTILVNNAGGAARSPSRCRCPTSNGPSG
jgi:7-alpha-hydroxysteroid dehydrogenase